MPERVAPRLRRDREPVRLLADRNLLHVAGRCIYRVDDVVVAAREPQGFSVGAYVPHVGASPARNRPGGFDLSRREVDYGDAAFPLRRSVNLIGSAICDVELFAIAARVETVGSDAGWNE